MGTEAGRAWLWTVVGGALCGLAFPPVGWWWTVLFAPALWLRYVRVGASGANAWLGLWWGLAFGAVVSWHAAPTFAQEARIEWLGGIAWTLTLVWFAAWSALFGWLVGRVRQEGWAWVGAAACLWTALAWGRSLGALGFPWAMLTLGLARQPLLLQPADLGGVWLTEWLIMAGNGAVALMWQGQARRMLTGLAVLGTVWAGYGAWQLYRYRAPIQMPLSVAVVQPKAERSLGIHAPAIFDEQMEGWLRQAVEQGAKWAVLPEVAEPQTLTYTASGSAERRLYRWRAWAQRYGLTIVLGAARFVDGKDYNSALGVAPSGAVGCYNKAKLMAFTEWAPPTPLSLLLKPLGACRSSLEAGSEPLALRVDVEPPIGTLICVESLFGWVGRGQAADGAQWLAVMAHDAWLIGRAVREQYADFCVVRAIETRRWVARASTVGLSGFYAPSGELVAVLPMGKPNVLVQVIEPRTEQTLYVRWGDWWAYLCALAGIVALGAKWKARSRQKPGILETEADIFVQCWGWRGRFRVHGSENRRKAGKRGEGVL